MDNKTIDGVPRELLERIAQWGSVTWPDKNELRALLAAPVVSGQEPVAQYQFMSKLQHKTWINVSEQDYHRAIAEGHEVRELFTHPAQRQGPPIAWRQIGPTGETGSWWDGAPTPDDIENVRAEAETIELAYGPLTNEGTIPPDVLADHNRLVRELDVLLNGEAGAADQASLCDIVAQVRIERTGSFPFKRYVRGPSRKDPKYHEEWPEIEGGPVFDGVTYCNDLFEALKRFNVIVAETMPENAVDE